MGSHFQRILLLLFIIIFTFQSASVLLRTLLI